MYRLCRVSVLIGGMANKIKIRQANFKNRCLRNDNGKDLGFFFSITEESSALQVDFSKLQVKIVIKQS